MEQTIETYNPNVELSSPVEDGKFDSHMKSARESSMQSRRKVFIEQNNGVCERKERYSNLKSSVY